ncbi:MAG: cellulase family glycosylhydrolase [Bifidobacteriaceae bacterium]|jgi:hypothetical protein|nr:cellulase family glycosylhydrolase [Bifidobacteriaceae bacterium]
MKQRWTEDQAWDWYTSRDWITGFNFIPSGAMNGGLWLLQEYQHEVAYRDAAREIALAASLGLNSIRFYLPFEVWQHQHDAFFAHLDELLALLDLHGMTMMPVIFNDCSVPKSRYREPIFGPQPEPVPGYFGGSDESPFDDDVQGGGIVGYVLTDEPELEPVFHQYVTELAIRYGHDDRVNIWNIWNEVGNSTRGDLSVPMMEKTFAWFREADVSQPLTAEVWGGGAADAYEWMMDPEHIPGPEARAVELSDVVSFHYYGDYTHSKGLIRFLRQFDRPLLNTEWMHRPYRSLIETHLPLWKREGVGSYFFGFVNGKAQFQYVWEFIKQLPGIDTRLWMHDIFHSDFTPYDPDEIPVLKACNLPPSRPVRPGNGS